MPQRFNYNMSFLEHLEELRGRLIICIVTFALTAGVGGFFFYQPVLDILRKPMEYVKPKEIPTITFKQGESGLWDINLPQNPETGTVYNHYSKDRIKFIFNDNSTFVWGHNFQSSLFYFNILTPYFLILKVALLIGITLASPMWIYQLWLFIAPGMKKEERKVMRPIFLSSVLLFPTGASFAYFILTFAVAILTNFQFEWLEPRLDVARYLHFVITFMLVFGVLFQTPLVLIILIKLGLVSAGFLAKYRKYALLIIMIISAMLTPADPITMLALGIPLFCLYEISIWIGYVVEPKKE